MNFKVVPILPLMKDFYQQPISSERFSEYIKNLQGSSKKDLELPIGGFNPMAKEHILAKIEELESLNAEHVMSESLQALQTSQKMKNDATIKVVLNLADDQKGGWTNKYTTDFDSKFKLNALVNRNFCTPYFYSSENYSKELIIRRTQAYALRTYHWKLNGKPTSLDQHLQQEIFVHKNLSYESDLQPEQIGSITAFYEDQRNSEEYTLLFNFFYGDQVSQSLGYPSYGVKDVNGFQLARQLAKSS